MPSNRHKFTEADITINEMFSRSGKATEDMYLPLAQVKQKQKERSLGLNGRANLVLARDRRSQIQN